MAIDIATRRAAKVARIERNRWHQYRLGDGPWNPGATTVLRVQDAISGSDALVNWAAKTSADAALDALLNEQVSREHAYERGLAAVTTARDRGTAVHAAIEAAIRDEAHVPEAFTHPYWYGWSRFLLKERPELLYTEQKVINTTYGFGTTMDIVARFRGQVAQIDIKSGSVKPTHVLQLAAGDMAERWATDEGTTDPLPLEAHYVLALSPDGYEVHEMPVGDEEREHFAFLAQTYHRLKKWKKNREEVAA